MSLVSGCPLRQFYYLRAVDKTGTKADLQCQPARELGVFFEQRVHCERDRSGRSIALHLDVARDDDRLRQLQLLRELVDDAHVCLVRNECGEVARLKPDLFWVGLSTPKQEKFMAQYWNKLDATLFFGVGAAFDFHAGRVRQAPRWMQRSGLEWLFRLACDPGRLWKRYLKNNPLFIARAFCQVTRLRKYSLD